MTTIGDLAFYGCDIDSLHIPSSVQKIGKIIGGRELYFESETPIEIESGTFDNIQAIFVPEDAYNAYINEWAEYADKIYSPSMRNCVLTIAQNPTLSALHRALGEEKLAKVLSLKLSGTMNSYDLMIIRNKMVKLQHLDLSDCQMVANKYEFYTGYCTQNDTIPAYAFYNLDNLLSVKLSNSIKHIGNYAFYQCNNLQKVVLPEALTSLSYGTFQECHSLKDIQLPNSLEIIGIHCFSNCQRLDSISIPEKVTVIPSQAFYDCINLRYIHLPKRLTKIESSAFGYCRNLRSISITSMIESIDDNAFYGCNALDTVYAYTIEPVSINQSTFSKYAFQNATLMVPRTSYYTYFYNTQWSQFLNLQEFDQPYEFVYLNNDYTLDGTTGAISGSPIVYINPTGALITESGIVQNSDEVVLRTQLQNSGYGYDQYGNWVYQDGHRKCATVFATDNLNATRLTTEYEVRPNQWYYLCFASNVKRSEIIVPGDYVVYTYDGATRATNGSGGWKRLADDEGFKRGQGYIFQCNQAGTLTASVANPDLKGQDYVQELSTYESTDSHNANWNFVGNPYTAYMPIQEMNCKSPITVWNQNINNYEAYSALDDHYILEPYQCFFVQKPKDQASITFKAEGRLSYTGSRNYTAQAPAMRMAQEVESARRVINLVISGEESSDKTRVVLNEEAQMNYEMECDAAKFMGNNAVQFYSLYNGVKYAINERPSDNHQVNLGYAAEKEGTYVISKSDKVANIALFDKQTGITTDLSMSNYSFNSKAGTFDDRFVLILTEESTGIDSMNPMTDGGTYYNAAGVEMGKDKQQLPAGTYLYKTGESVTKVVIK